MTKSISWGMRRDDLLVFPQRGWLDIADDEQFLSRAHEPQLAARDFLDRRGIFPQPARFLAKRCVLRAQPRKVCRQLIILFSRAHRGDQAVIADERVDDEHADNEEEQAREDAAAVSLRTLCAEGPGGVA